MANSNPKPPNAGKGRPKGATNKLGRTVKSSIEAAFDMVGGPLYLARQAEENPVAFMTLLGKVLPLQIQADIMSKVIGMPEIVIERPNE